MSGDHYRPLMLFMSTTSVRKTPLDSQLKWPLSSQTLLVSETVSSVCLHFYVNSFSFLQSWSGFNWTSHFKFIAFLSLFLLCPLGTCLEFCPKANWCLQDKKQFENPKWSSCIKLYDFCSQLKFSQTLKMNYDEWLKKGFVPPCSLTWKTHSIVSEERACR